MANLRSKLYMLLIAAMFSGSAFMVGCGGGVDEEQMEALNNLKAEVESLRSQVKAKEDEKASLQKQIADQEAKNKKCTEDLASTKNCVDTFNKGDNK
jgi:septal ring factor EnvC (AmiA/AmiB activator)